VSELRTYLSDTAQRELDALRAALETRLMALEKALAHPDPSESLESLIIDLARIASDEAHAAAARHWLEAQASAEELASPSDVGGMQGALMEEAAALRREVEDLQTRIARETERSEGLRRDAEAAHAALQQRGGASALEEELARLRSVNQDLAEAVETLRGDLDGARKRLADTVTEKQSARARDAEASRAAAALQARYDELERQAATEREHQREQLSAADERAAAAAARAEAAEANVQAEIAKVREAESVWASEAEKVRALEAALASEKERVRAAEAAVAAEVKKAHDGEETLAAERARAAAAERSLRDELSTRAKEVRALHADLSDESSRIAEKLGAAEGEVHRLRSDNQKLSADFATARDRGQAVDAELASARTVFEAARQEAAAALTAATTKIRELELQLFRRGQAAAGPVDVDLGTMLEDRAPAGERPIRRYSRYSFRSLMSVDVEGQSARLVDLSVGGAQILSERPLELQSEVAVSLVSDEVPVSGRATVMWARADPQSKGRALRYRAGIQFTDVDPAAVEAFIIRYSST